MTKTEISGLFVPYHEEKSIDMATDEGKALIFGALQLRAPILECRLIGSKNWGETHYLLGCFKKGLDGLEFRIQPEESVEMPTIPEGETWHNLDNLSPKQFGTHNGWRPLLKSEVESGNISKDDQCYFANSRKHWYETKSKSNKITYRTQKALPKFKIKIAATEKEYQEKYQEEYQEPIVSI